VLSTCASPYVTQYKTSFLRGSKLWIVMEYLGGGSCQDLVWHHDTLGLSLVYTDIVISSKQAPSTNPTSPSSAASSF